jgi:hypothetical protein
MLGKIASLRESAAKQVKDLAKDALSEAKDALREVKIHHIYYFTNTIRQLDGSLPLNSYLLLPISPHLPPLAIPSIFCHLAGPSTSEGSSKVS